MMNWRDLMAAPPEILTHPQYPQNPQNGEVRDTSFADIADIADRVAAEKVALVSTPRTQAGEGLPLPIPPPIPPLQAGWTIAYMDHTWRLCGGYEDRAHATVAECRWVAGAWIVTLSDGQEMPLSQVRAVGAVDHKGRLYGAWTVREHGYNGEGPIDGRMLRGEH